ncbi:MAG: HlyD family efflux transporter periplasmic adaptor subunit [Acetobacteraceae bacterium]
MPELKDPPKTGGATQSPPPRTDSLPAVIPPPPAPAPKRAGWTRRLPLLLLLLAAAGGAGYWYLHPRTALPPGFAVGNGRLDADEIDIDTKYPGRIAELKVDEGDLVKTGQVLAVMDTRDVQAQLKANQALMQQAQHSLDQAKADYANQEAVVKLAEQEIARTRYLVPKGFASVQQLDQQQQSLTSARAKLNSNDAAIHVAERALQAATHQVEYYAVQIADSQLMAPRDGPIEYRVANVGEVLPAGGKVFTMLDANYVYMDVYLPTVEAGRVALGSEARIVLDAYPDRPLPARVSYISSQAQFTPKTVETKDERDKLMFRVRARIEPAVLAGAASVVRNGLPGVTYVRTDPAARWPANLDSNPAPDAKAK